MPRRSLRSMLHLVELLNRVTEGVLRRVDARDVELHVVRVRRLLRQVHRVLLETSAMLHLVLLEAFQRLS